MIGSMLILLALIGQPPGADRPAPLPTPVVSKPGKGWIDILSPIDGHPMRILGWYEAGQPRFDPRDYPQLVKGPAPAPAPSPAPWPAGHIPTGVIAEKMPHLRPGAAWYGGNIPAKAEGDAKVSKPDVYLTFIGDKGERKAALAKLRGDPQAAGLIERMGDRLAINDYDPGNPMVADVGLPAGGRPDVVIQDATGKELSRHRGDPGPDRIAAEIRKADPHYRPAADPPEEGGIPDFVWYAAGGLALVFIVKALTKP